MSQILVKRPNQPVEVVDLRVGQEYEHIREIVGGYLTFFRLRKIKGLAVFCDEDGEPRRLPFNCRIEGQDYLGTIVVAVATSDTIEGIPLIEQPKAVKLFPL